VQDYLSEAAYWTFEEEISQLPLLSRLSVLELELEMKRHAFAPLVLHLLHQIPPTKALNIKLTQARKVNIQSVLLLTKIFFSEFLATTIVDELCIENYRH